MTATLSQQAPTTKPLPSGHRYLPWLKPLRLDKHWTQERLATEADVTCVTIYRLEHGAPAQLCTVHRLAAALGVSSQVLGAPADILGFRG